MLLPTRCEELKKKLASNEEELKWVNEQLLMAVQQKFKLQQQIEDWQVSTQRNTSSTVVLILVVHECILLFPIL